MWLLRLYYKSFQGLSIHTWILALTMLVNRIGSMVLLFAPLYLTNDLQYTMTQSGIAMAFYGIGGVLGSYMGGALADRYSYKKIMIATLILAAAFMMPLLFVTTFIPVSFLLFFIGLFSDMFRPANSLALGSYTTEENRTRSFSLIRLAANLGFGIGPALGGIMAATIGFKWVFVYDALTCLIAALLVFLYLPYIKTKSQVTEANHEKRINQPPSSAYKDKKYLIFIALVSCYAICFFQLFASVPIYFSKVMLFDEKTIGYLLALNGLLVVFVEMPIVAKLESYKKPMRLIAFGTLMLVFCFPILFITSWPIAAAILYTIIITLSEVFAMPFMSTFALSRPHESVRGQYMALYSIAYGIAITLAPTIGLGIADALGFTFLYIAIPVVSLVISTLYYFLD